MTKGQRVEYRNGVDVEDWTPGTLGWADERNGQRIYDVKLDDGRTKWGYEDQFRVVE